ncbi:MAG: N-acetylglucosamine-6-phosphate deacetylase [Parvularculaceae bacterium]
MTSTVFINTRIFINGRFTDGAALVIGGGRVIAVSSETGAMEADRIVDAGGRIIAPGFVDVQVNGGGGALFNDDPSPETIETIAAAHRRFGVTSLLPTLISDDVAKIERAIAAVDAAIDAQAPGVVGLHVEGPFLNREKRGIHDDDKIRPLSDDVVELLCAPRRGALVVTLAPECVDHAQISRLAAAGVRVCAGHTNATYDEARAALNAGVVGFTHLFNAMSPLQSRAPGVIAAALESDAWCGVIVDGRHVHPAMLRLALRAKADGRFMLVSDAMPAVGADIDHFYLGERRIEVRNGVCLSEDGTLAGAALDLNAAVRNAVSMLNVDPATALTMASEAPSQFLGLSEEVGRLAPGARADFVVLSADLNVEEVWIGGEPALPAGLTA